MNQLAALLGVDSAPKLGAGMAEKGRQALMSRQYQIHVQEARANGQEPLTPEQFARMQRGS